MLRVQPKLLSAIRAIPRKAPADTPPRAATFMPEKVTPMNCAAVRTSTSERISPVAELVMRCVASNIQSGSKPRQPIRCTNSRNFVSA
jgi:hypothetical protein